MKEPFQRQCSQVALGHWSSLDGSLGDCINLDDDFVDDYHFDDDDAADDDDQSDYFRDG